MGAIEKGRYGGEKGETNVNVIFAHIAQFVGFGGMVARYSGAAEDEERCFKELNC